MSTAIMLKHYGCKKIMMIDFSEFRLQNAREFGFLTCNPNQEDLQAKAFEEFGHRRVYGGEKCFEDITAMIKEGNDISPLISQEFSLDDIEEALITHGNFEIAQKVAITYET